MYLEIDEGFDSHPKTVRLCRVMGDVNAGQYLIRLWAWACRSAPDGDISGMVAADVEAVAKYQAADGKLFAALTETWSPKFGPWIDVDGTSVRLHGWAERTGAAIARMAASADRMKRHRERKREERCANDARTMRERDEDASRTFVVVQSSPVQSSQEISPPAPARVAQGVPGRPTPYNTVSRFLAIRAEILGIEKGKLFSQPQSGELEKAGAWLASMGEDEVADIEPAIRKACQHAKARSPGWTHESITNSAFLLGAIISKWRDLREELHGLAPKVAAPPDRPGQQRPVHYPSLMRGKT